MAGRTQAVLPNSTQCAMGGGFLLRESSPSVCTQETGCIQTTGGPMAVRIASSVFFLFMLMNAFFTLTCMEELMPDVVGLVNSAPSIVVELGANQ